MKDEESTLYEVVHGQDAIAVDDGYEGAADFETLVRVEKVVLFVLVHAITLSFRTVLVHHLLYMYVYVYV